MRTKAPLFTLDASWLFLLAGLSLVSAAAIIPAIDDLRTARFHRDRAVAMERYRLERLASYSAYLGALDAEHPTLLRSLATSQLNLVPEGTELVVFPARTNDEGADVFADLDPDYEAPEPPKPIGSTLERWSLDPATRLWLLAGGAFCTLLGVLPTASARRRA